ncbi:MAG: aromatic aminobenezylarsenical efflux permease ArsG family transporter [Bacteroidaceae bacterium]
MEWIQNMLDNSSMPIVTAFLLGMLTAVSPCPMATNITAIGYIGRQLESKRGAFFCGLLYTAGRILAYTLMGAILIYLIRSGSDMFSIQQQVSLWGETLLPPALVIIGLFMLFGNRIPVPKINISMMGSPATCNGCAGGFLLGIFFSMAFCPTSGLLYFGMLIPMSASETGGYLLPVVYAFATGLPTMLVAWVLAFSMSSIGKVYGRIQIFQKWFNIVVATLFILVGIYYELQ